MLHDCLMQAQAAGMNTEEGHSTTSECQIKSQQCLAGRADIICWTAPLSFAAELHPALFFLLC